MKAEKAATAIKHQPTSYSNRPAIARDVRNDEWFVWRSAGLWSLLSFDQHGAEVVDVREGGAGLQKIAQGCEEGIGVVVGEHRLGIELCYSRTGERVGCDALSSEPSMPSVSAASA